MSRGCPAAEQFVPPGHFGMAAPTSYLAAPQAAHNLHANLSGTLRPNKGYERALVAENWPAQQESELKSEEHNGKTEPDWSFSKHRL